MSTEEMIAELEEILRAQPDPEGYYTAKEWGQMLGITSKVVNERLWAVKKAGRLAHVRVKRPALNGKMMPSDAYRIVPAQ